MTDELRTLIYKAVRDAIERHVLPKLRSDAAAIETLRMTDAERNTVADLSRHADWYGLTRSQAKTLRGLLRRTAATEKAIRDGVA